MTSKPAETISTHNGKGAFVRSASEFRDIISMDHPKYQPGFGRYHLYISHACPWANRCHAVIRMKGLTDCISITATHPTWMKTKPNDPEDPHFGWGFIAAGEDGSPVFNPAGKGPFSITGCDFDPINGCKFVRDIYELNTLQLKKFTVPILFDKHTNSIVNNESSEIVRMLNTEFNEWAVNPALDLYPAPLRETIDTINEWTYPGINDGVYRCGFAKSQEAYLAAVTALFDSLDRLEEILSKSRYLASSSQLTEADVRVFMTLARFDEVYVVYFKCNKKRIADYEHIYNYMRELWQTPGLGDSINMEHIKTHYYTSHPPLNVHAVIPIGPDAIGGFMKPHNRDELFPISSQVSP